MNNPEMPFQKLPEGKKEGGNLVKKIGDTAQKTVLYGAIGLGIVKVLDHEIKEYNQQRDKNIQPTGQTNPTQNSGTQSQNKNIQQIEQTHSAHENVEADFQNNLQRLKNSPDFISDGSGDKFNEQRDWILEKMNDPAYQMRAKIEKLSDQDIQDRKNRLEKITILYFKGDGVLMPNSDRKVRAYTQHFGDKEIIVVAIDAWGFKQGDPTIVHESEHGATSGDSKMSEYAKKVYTEAARSPEEEAMQTPTLSTINPITNEKIQYICSKEQLKKMAKEKTDPTELDARKKVLEYELEKMGVRKYGEEFTDSIIQKVFELYRTNKLSVHSLEFLDHIKLDHLKKIMNTIATNEIYDKDNPYPFQKALEEYNQNKA